MIQTADVGNHIVLVFKEVQARLDFFSDDLRRVALLDTESPAEQINQRKVSEIARVGIALTFAPGYIFTIQGGFKLFHQSALAGAGVTAKRDKTAFSSPDSVQGFFEQFKLRITPYHVGPQAMKPMDLLWLINS